MEDGKFGLALAKFGEEGSVLSVKLIGSVGKTGGSTGRRTERLT